MAHILPIPQQWLTKNPKAAKLEGFVNVDQAVGPNCPNLHDDVKLIQGLIRIWGGAKYTIDIRQITTRGLKQTYIKEHDFIGLIPIVIKLDQPFQHLLPEANGQCDEVTITWIRMFQMVHHNHLNKKIDGRVDPASALSNPGRPNTIMLLNSMRLREGFGAMPADYFKPQ